MQIVIESLIKIKGGEKIAREVNQKIPAINRRQDWDMPEVDKAVWALHV